MSAVTPYDLNLRHLLAVSAIGQLGSLGRAAEVVHLSQPALTQAVVKLEGQLQHRLFDRQAQGMTPTSAGTELIERVDRAADELAPAFDAAQGSAAKRSRGGRAILLRISFTHLRAAVAAVEFGNFVLASRATGISPPAIHRAVREFERLTEITLFERRGRSVAPTPRARAVVAAARRAVAEIAAALADLAARRGQGGGRVTIGALPLARARLIPEAVAAFLAAQPDTAVSIVDGPYAELFARLVAGELDLMVGALRNPHPSPEVVQTPLYEDRLVVVARAGHPLTRAKSVTLADLAAFRWIMAAPGVPMRGMWEAMFEDAGHAVPPVAIECSSVFTIHGLLAEGDWLTLLSPEQVGRELAAGRLAVLMAETEGAARTIGVTTRAGWRPSGAQAAFLAELKTKAATRKK
jgi:DNA-binding transcriptional LysR family regulator